MRFDYQQTYYITHSRHGTLAYEIRIDQVFSFLCSFSSLHFHFHDESNLSPSTMLLRAWCEISVKSQSNFHLSRCHDRTLYRRPPAKKSCDVSTWCEWKMNVNFPYSLFIKISLNSRPEDMKFEWFSPDCESWEWEKEKKKLEVVGGLRAPSGSFSRISST